MRSLAVHYGGAFAKRVREDGNARIFIGLDYLLIPAQPSRNYVSRHRLFCQGIRCVLQLLLLCGNNVESARIQSFGRFCL